MAAPSDAKSSTVESHTVVSTGSVKAQATRAPQSAMQASAHTRENRHASRRKRGELAASLAKAASRAASPLAISGRSAADISGLPASTEMRMQKPIEELMTPSLASMIRGLPDQKLTAAPTTF